MTTINREQLLSLDNGSKARILKLIALGSVEYINDDTSWEADMIEENMNHIPRID